NNFAGFGGIGAYTTYLDFQGYFEKQGVIMRDIYPDISSEKNEEYRAAQKGDFSLMEAGVAELAQFFIDSFAENRADKLKNNSWNKGRAFNGKKHCLWALLIPLVLLSRQQHYLQVKPWSPLPSRPQNLHM